MAVVGGTEHLAALTLCRRSRREVTHQAYPLMLSLL
jgi:hypothetical protein